MKSKLNVVCGLLLTVSILGFCLVFFDDSPKCPDANLSKDLDNTQAIISVYKMGFEDGKRSKGEAQKDSIIYIKVRKHNKNIFWQ